MRDGLISVVLVVALISACSNDGSYGTEITSDEFETDYSSVYAETVFFRIRK